MISVDAIKKDPKKFAEGMKAKGANIDVEGILALDERRRGILKEAEELRAQRNALSEEIGKLSKDERGAKLTEAQRIKNAVQEKEKELEKTQQELMTILAPLPNPPADDVPRGDDENANVVVRTEGEKPDFSFEAKDYLAIAQQYDLIDIKRAAKVSGTRFGYLKNQAVLLEFALVRLALDMLLKEGFVPVVPPVLIKSEYMQKLGYLEKEPDEIYYLEKDDRYLVGTAEHSLVPMFADETFVEKDMPKRLAGFSTAFRREAGSYGKDTRGILRVHQFDKLEMVSLVKPQDSKKEHEYLVSLQEKLVQALELPYQVVHLSSGDMGFVAHDQYDIETWIPSEGAYRETHSASNTTDFQARRLNIRYKKPEGSEFVHILNATAFAIPRTLIALLENHQTEQGTVRIPKALQPYTGFDEIS